MLVRRPRYSTNPELLAVVIILTGWLLGYGLHVTTGHWLISRMYEGTMPLGILKGFIQGQAVHTLDHYLRFADSMFLLWSHRLAVGSLLVMFAWNYRFLLFKKSEVGAPSHVPASLLLALVLIAGANRFIQDDAFISFRYASNLAYGLGLTWNPGEAPIEGYTNPLWTILMAIPILLDIDPIRFSFALGLFCFAGSIQLTYALAFRVLMSARLALLSVILLGTNYTFSAYATGGLETQMQTFLLLCVSYKILGLCHNTKWQLLSCSVVSLIATMAMLTRLDSALPLTVLYGTALWHLLKSRESLGSKLACATALLLPGLAIGILYAWWKLAYYGHLLPNTFFAKAAGATSLDRGWRYLYNFLGSYGWIPFIILAIVTAKQVEARTRGVRPMLFLIAIWIAYVVKVGGCFMEYRFWVTVLPFMVIWLVGSLSVYMSSTGGIAMIIGLAIMSFFHQQSFRGVGEVESVRGLSSHISASRWDDIGKVLGQMFYGKAPDVTIGTTAAGAIPYYSKLRTVDMHGLNDAWVARNGHVIGTRPGHQRAATISYLIDKQVNLVIGHPLLVTLPSSEIRYTIANSSFSMRGVNKSYFPDEAKVVEIPLDIYRAVHVLYLVQNRTVDDVIQSMNLKIFPIER